MVGAASVAVLDEDADGRSALRAFVDALPGTEVVASAGGVQEALDALAALHPSGVAPDLVVVNTHPGGVDAVAATRALTATFPQVRVLILTTVRDPRWAHSVLRAGAKGYVLKDGDVEHLEAAIAAVAAGRRHIDPVVGRRLAPNGRPWPADPESRSP